jgi:3-hydroxyacyl-CoA dehydrogenase
LRGQTAEEVYKRLSATTELKEALKGAVYAQECVPEKLEFKKQIFEQMDAIADPETVLASSTSNITASKFTENLKGRHRCLVAHPVLNSFFSYLYLLS